ncbi:MAG: tetratricopeptide repeat protein [Phycisphaerae bacterium]|nr:tetratricopeptide repeat protein [Phycisphaerae bacterium]MCZ2399594.1 tetratricopeptide repeat protein [Phycisphaerae bacterium]
MRILLAGFVTCCGLLTAWCAWLIWPPPARETAPPARETASVAPGPAPTFAVAAPPPASAVSAVPAREASQTSDECAAALEARQPPAPAAPLARAADTPAPKRAEHPAPVRWPRPITIGQRHALDTIVETLREEPDHPAALRDAADWLMTFGDWSTACEPLSRLAELHPDDAATQWAYATALMRLERWYAALTPLKRVVELRAESPQAWHNLAIAHQALGHLREALAAWNRVLELAPGHAPALAYRGELYMELQDWSKAADDLALAWRAEPESIDAALNLAACLRNLGDTAAAIATLEEARARAPNDVVVLRRLFMAQREAWLADPQRREAREAALRFAERLIVLDPGQSDVAALAEELRGMRP